MRGISKLTSRSASTLFVYLLAYVCDFLSYIGIFTHHGEFLTAYLRSEVVGTEVLHSILCEAQVGRLATLQAVEQLAQHLLRHLDPLSEGGGSAFVGVTEGQGELTVFAADDGQG